MGDRVFPHVTTAYTTIVSIRLLYNPTTPSLNGTLPCVDFIDVIMGDILEDVYPSFSYKCSRLEVQSLCSVWATCDCKRQTRR